MLIKPKPLRYAWSPEGRAAAAAPATPSPLTAEGAEMAEADDGDAEAENTALAVEFMS